MSTPSSDAAARPHDPVSAEGRPSILQLILPFWRSKECGPALIQLAVILAIMFTGVYLHVWGNKLLGQVTDALVGREWAELARTMGLSISVAVMGAIIVITNVAVQQLLELRWRTWLTRRYLDEWVEGHTFYDIEQEGSLSNADQRIAEDVRIFVHDTLSLSLNVVSVFVHAGTYTVLIWNLSGTLRFQVGGIDFAIPGYMVYLAYGYTLGGLLLVHWLGKRLIGLNMHKQTVEADYRYRAMQLRENAEQIAFYAGGGREHRSLMERFEHVRTNFRAMVYRTAKVDFARNIYGQLFKPLPTVAALPLYFVGTITIGGITRIANAFELLTSTLSFFSQAYVGFTAWLAVTNRLRDLSWAMSKARHRSSGFVVTRDAQAELSTGPLQLRSPLGELLTEVSPQCFAPGERWLVRGPSGTGKSTLLRAVAGLWPFGAGRIQLPADASIMFLPQRSYIPDGSLKSALAYPGEPEQFSEADCVAALQVVGLAGRFHSLTQNERWQQKLSGGEQQRLAIARALLHQPDYLFLDEATSALDEAGERRAYEAIIEQLPRSAVISVAHRSALLQYHDRLLELHPAEA